MKKFKLLLIAGITIIIGACNASKHAVQKNYNENHRPQFHFSPKKAWMNDPNGMVYLKGKYHLFFQHNPDSTVWGPMHWGHTVSTDLVYWEEQPIAFYSSLDLKTWNKESDFGKDQGAHGGVWECPDLFPLELNGKTHWVLLVSINPGGPNGGSATQYFVGQFDGKNFTPEHKDTRWLDYGTDNYAGVTWSNTGSRKIFLGWMSNWQYANVVPTDSWRSANTVPRELKLKTINSNIFVSSEPVKELEKITLKSVSLTNIIVNGSEDFSSKFNINGKFKLQLSSEELRSFCIVLANDLGEELRIGYDESGVRYYIDRTKAGKSSFEKGFAKIHYAPRISKSKSTDITLLADATSVELFADEGLTVMTDIFFPNKTMNKISLKSDAGFSIKSLNYAPVEGIWK